MIDTFADPTTMVPSLGDTPLQPFAETSRYRDLPLLMTHDSAGREVMYVGRRWIPPPEKLAEVTRYQVRAGDRIDNIAADQLTDPELYWRIADANAALAPAELTERVGRWLRITLAEGVPGPRRV
jgi:hypothetical protein